MKYKGILLGVLVFIGQAGAWEVGGTQITQGAGDETEARLIAPEGKDYFYVLWSEVPGDYRRVVAGKFSISTGEPLWSSPFIVADTGRNQWQHQAVATPSGALVIVFQANFASEGAEYSIYATKIAPDKTWGWPSRWLKLSSVEAKQREPQLCLSPSGEIYCTYTDYRNYETTGSEVRVARVTEEGEVAFEKKVGNGGAGSILPSRDGDAILLWGGTSTEDTIWKIRLHRISLNGAFKWHLSLNPQYYTGWDGTISDNREGIIMLFTGGRHNYGLRVQRISSEGEVCWDSMGVFIKGWGSSYLTLLSNGGYGFSEDGYGGCLVSTSKGDIPLEHWVYRVDSIGEKVWPDGVKVWTSDYWPGYRGVHAIVRDGSGGCISAWDTKSDSTEGDILSARVDETGALQWTVPLCEAPRTQEMRVITSVPGGAILCWEDFRNNNVDIYCQRVDTLGVGIEEKNPYRPLALKLCSSPNPFTQETFISYTLSHLSQVRLDIFDVSGRRVRVLERGFKEAGNYRMRWNKRNDKGRILPSGIYFCRFSLERGKRAIINKLIVSGRKEAR